MTIEGRALGQRRPLFADFSIVPPDDFGDGGPFRLRDLIAHVVRQEVTAFERRQQARRLDRVLAPETIERGLVLGKVSPEGLEPKLRPAAAVDAEAAVATALEAFVDGLYLVVIDGTEFRDLDAIVPNNRDCRVAFIRLIFLAGA